MMVDAVTNGRPGSAMMGFASVLNAQEIDAVVDFVRSEFMEHARLNTRYHTPENGWPGHEKYSAAYPFALGQLPIDTASEKLTPQQQLGKEIFLSSCVSCHDRSRVNDEGAIWESRPLSFPRNGYSHRTTKVDAESGASPYAVHERAPRATNLTFIERQGQELYQQNCAFCHAADGTGHNWIGSFLDAHPRDLTGTRVASLTDEQLVEVVSMGIKDTTMPAWKTVLTSDQIRAVVAYVRHVFVTPPERSNSANVAERRAAQGK
jgi:cytochrome c oxidase cbb3-type subunit III